MTEQEFIERIIAGHLNEMLHNLDLCIEEQKTEQQDDVLGLPPDEWTESAENEPEEADKFEQRDSSQLIKPRGKCVNIDGWDV